MTKPITVLILSRNRPLYLWACLDALYRHTAYPHKFFLCDMASDDPMVDNVIRGFERRGMFDRILRAERNDPRILAELAYRELSDWAPYVAYVESDVVVEETAPCWLERMAALMEERPRLAMLGSAIDRRDFVDPAKVEGLRGDEDPIAWRARLKADSLERGQDIAEAGDAPLFRPHNPAGRLLLLRVSAMQEIGLITNDAALDGALRAAGYETAIATRVRHRHLSLVQVFDYPGYDMALRDRFTANMEIRDLD